MNTPSKILLVVTTVSLPFPLAACGTVDFKTAEPEKFAALDCEQLAQLSESYRPTHEVLLFDSMDRDAFERNVESGRSERLGRDRPGTQLPYEANQEQDRRSIALARRQKGCI